MKSIAISSGVPESYGMILTFLARHPGVSQKELAAHRNITTSSISQTVKEMQLTGYIKKEVDEKDQRYIKLFLTEKGYSCAKEIISKIHLADDRITELTTPKKEAELISMMEKLTEIIKKELTK